MSFIKSFQTNELVACVFGIAARTATVMTRPKTTRKRQIFWRVGIKRFPKMHTDAVLQVILRENIQHGAARTQTGLVRT
mgnify:FL=1